MNFEQLEDAGHHFDEILAVGRDVIQEGRLYHIVGMVRRLNSVKMYVLERSSTDRGRADREGIVGEKADRDRIDAKRADRESSGWEWINGEGAGTERDVALGRHNNRAGFKATGDSSFFFRVEQLRVGTQTFTVRSASSSCLGLDDSDNYQRTLFFVEMKKAGWGLPPAHEFYRMDWEELMLTEVVFYTIENKLPDWKGQEVVVRLGKGSVNHFVEKPVKLVVGQEQEVGFALEDGRKVTCYINKVYPIDIWKEQEEKFEKLSHLEDVTAEMLRESKKEFFQTLMEDCPKGMYYLGIEYECTLEGNIVFYDKKFLGSEPKVYKGSSRALLMLLKPDEPVGKHGLRQRGCIIQTSVEGDIRHMEAELFNFYEELPEREERLPEMI